MCRDEETKANIENNPYITVSVLHKNRTSVQHWHPDVFHYKKALQASLVSNEGAELMALREELTDRHCTGSSYTAMDDSRCTPTEARQTIHDEQCT